MATTIKLTGHDAIDAAKYLGMTVDKYADPTGPARKDISVAEAEAIAAEDPFLVYLEIEMSIDVGHKVQAGEGEDADTGWLASIDGAMATVGWDSGVTTEIPVWELEAL